jgi:hypothetical protein
VLKTDKEEIDKVCNKYSGEKGYSSTLNASLDSLRKDIKKAVEDAKAARDQWVGTRLHLTSTSLLILL